jgi:predicted ATPase
MIDSGPVLDKFTITLSPDSDANTYPLNLKIIQNLKEFKFAKQVTFLVGENGSGKSTILETLAEKIGFGKGGSKNLSMMSAQEGTVSDVKSLCDNMLLSWRVKVDGYFFRAESFWDIANKLDIMSQTASGAFTSYGGTNLHAMSHGEAFLALFKNRIGQGGIYILDEPEAALSPQRQLALLAIIHELCEDKKTQFIIATHSPILLAYPNAQILSCDGDELREIAYEETDHYQITKNFLNNPKQYFKNLFN